MIQQDHETCYCFQQELLLCILFHNLSFILVELQTSVFDLPYSNASSEPILAEPDIIGGLDVTNMTGFLMMYSNGLSQSLIEATGTSQANLDLAYMAMAEFEVQATLSGVAQAVVDKVVRRHHDTYLSEGGRMAICQKRDDITLIVRNFNFPLGNRMSSPAPAAPYTSVSAPFSPQVSMGSPQPPRLTITSANNRLRTDSQNSLMTPLYIQVDNNAVSPIDQQRSPFGRLIGDLTPQPGIPQPNFDELQHTPRPSYPEEEDEGQVDNPEEDTENTRTSSCTDSTNPSTEESQRVFDFNGRDPKPKVDENGMIDPYVDFTDFFQAYKNMCPDPTMSSS